MITVEQWKQIKTALDGICGGVKFRYKEKTLSVYVTQRGRKLELEVYINGEIRGYWQNPVSEMHPLAKEVWYTSIRQVYSAKQKKELKHFLNKKELNQKVETLLPWFPSPTVLIRQYKKLEGLELLEVL